jgi:hypothetical protein
VVGFNFVDFVVGFCWVGGGYGWALLGLWWVFIFFNYFAPNTVKYLENKPFFVKITPCIFSLYY